MTIDLEPESSAGTSFASVKLDKVDDVWVGMLIGYDDKAPLYKFRRPGSLAPRERELTPDGREKTQDVLTVLLMARTNCRVRMPREPGQQEGEDVNGSEAVGTVARIFIKGHNRWTPDRPDSFRQMKEKHGKFQVGDVVWGKVTGIVPGEGSEPKKIVGFGMRKAKPEEAPLVQRCVDEYHRLNAVPLEGSSPASGTSGAPSFEEEPF